MGLLSLLGIRSTPEECPYAAGYVEDDHLIAKDFKTVREALEFVNGREGAILDRRLCNEREEEGYDPDF